MHIKVEHLELAPADLYKAELYPGDGVYLVRTGKEKGCVQVMCRATLPGCTTPVISFLSGAEALIEHGTPGALVQGLATTAIPPALPEDFMLRALAIAAKPDLAKDLLSQR